MELNFVDMDAFWPKHQGFMEEFFVGLGTDFYKKFR